MRHLNRKPFSSVRSNKHCSLEAGWNVVGGTSVTIDKGFASYQVQQGIGKDKKWLRRGEYSRLEERRTKIFTVFLLVDRAKTTNLTQHGHNNLHTFENKAKLTLIQYIFFAHK